ncbi:MAG: class I SAM-dependent methyltransferase [Ignavibacteriae bacterium]|nr:class I SAM-dependent methyltransferase [Ignavibacteriota bacterium]
MDIEVKVPARGKPAEYDQEIVKRRFRLTISRVDLKNKLVLDFGCGNGAQTIEFTNSGCKIIAVDIDKGDLTILENYLRSRNINTIVPFQYDGSCLPIESTSIDVVLSYEVLEHVNEESFALLDIYRVLKPGGDFILTVPNKGWIFETHGAYLPLLPWNCVPFFSYFPHLFIGD